MSQIACYWWSRRSRAIWDILYFRGLVHAVIYYIKKFGHAIYRNTRDRKEKITSCDDYSKYLKKQVNQLLYLIFFFFFRRKLSLKNNTDPTTRIRCCNNNIYIYTDSRITLWLIYSCLHIHYTSYVKSEFSS